MNAIRVFGIIFMIIPLGVLLSYKSGREIMNDIGWPVLGGFSFLFGVILILKSLV